MKPQRTDAIAWAGGPRAVRLAAGAGPADLVRKALAAPIADTLFFAGEATYAEQGGTVAGALESGVRGARELLTSLGRLS